MLSVSPGKGEKDCKECKGYQAISQASVFKQAKKEVLSKEDFFSAEKRGQALCLAYLVRRTLKKLIRETENFLYANS